jgi:hypothetical protein
MTEGAWWPHRVAEVVERTPARPAAGPAANASPLGSLVYRRAIYSRNDVCWFSARSWSSRSRRADVDALKAAKRRLDPGVIASAAEELAEMVRLLVGAPKGWLVTTVPVGHSRRPDSFAVQVAGGVASRLGLEFDKVFADRFVAGSSHPKEYRKLPPLCRLRGVATPAIIVDDVATSGWHLEESLTHLRAMSVPVLAVSWISGSVR